MKTIDPKLLQETIRRIVEALQPQVVYLYGSHAYGQPHADSDLDLLVVVEDSAVPPHRRAVPAYRALRGLCLPAEIIVATQAEFERRAQWQSSIERVAAEKGKVLYEMNAPHEEVSAWLRKAPADLLSARILVEHGPLVPKRWIRRGWRDRRASGWWIAGG